MRRFDSTALPCRIRNFCVATLLATLCTPDLARGDVPWPLDRVTLQNGKVVEGLIEEQTDQSLHMLEIRSKQKGLYGVYLPLQRSQVAKIVKLSEADRQATRQRFDEYRNRVRIEAEQMESFELKRKGQALYYAGEFYSLESTAPEVIVRRSIVRIEQIFAAMQQMIPAHGAPTRPIAIRLFGTTKEYREFVEQLRLPIANPAVFHRPSNTIAVGEDLSQLAQQLGRIQAHHDKQRAELEKEREGLPKALEKKQLELDKSPANVASKRSAFAKIKNELEGSLNARERQLAAAQRRNDETFARATSSMFAMLYHEALHAYLENFVYPAEQYEVPRWLHEGLAQIFESSTLAGKIFHVEAPHGKSLKLLQESLASVSLRELLTADGSSFLVAHGQNSQASRLNYAGSWGLAHYLTFHRHLVGSLAMDQFVQRDSDRDSPIRRFEELVQMPLAAFETQWRAYILSLKPVGAAVGNVGR